MTMKRDSAPSNTAAPMLSEGDAANLLGISVRTLQASRCTGRGPRFVKIGRRVLYRQTDIDAYIEARVFDSTSAYEGAAA